jgi:carbonic anhydrase
MEMPLVHKSADGRLAVVGVLIAQGAENAALAPLFRALPVKAGDETDLNVALDLAQVLPREHGAFRYPGSLTTPPCSEGVEWVVLERPITLSREQIAAFTAIIGDDHRPVQPLNGRTVTAALLRVR